MGSRLRRAGIVLLPLLAYVALAAAAAPTISVKGAWTRPAAAGMNAAGYLTIVNSGPLADALVSAGSPAADRVELHRSAMSGTVATMRPMAQIAVPAHGAARLAPGGMHLMLAGLKQALRAGDTVPVRLRFRRAGRLDIALAVGQGPRP